MRELDSDQKVFCVVALLLTLLLAFLIGVFNHNSDHKRNAMVDMVKAGADPIVAHCAIYGLNGTNNGVICVQVAEKK